MIPTGHLLILAIKCRDPCTRWHLFQLLVKLVSVTVILFHRVGYTVINPGSLRNIFIKGIVEIEMVIIPQVNFVKISMNKPDVGEAKLFPRGFTVFDEFLALFYTGIKS